LKDRLNWVLYLYRLVGAPQPLVGEEHRCAIGLQLAYRNRSAQVADQIGSFRETKEC